MTWFDSRVGYHSGIGCSGEHPGLISQVGRFDSGSRYQSEGNMDSRLPWKQEYSRFESYQTDRRMRVGAPAFGVLGAQRSPFIGRTLWSVADSKPVT